ncbi:protein indeterminate-domain 7 [Canna indica]|uniref:Protein EARLY HEADING DATE 2 n=1 Tax=Canna indica TaxID=4628 RepID=A0AAQ3JZR4_9LILI|nr:protein indeterminate-domain 7 [Canna indica]
MFLLAPPMCNSTSVSEEATVSSETRLEDHFSLSSLLAPLSPPHQPQQPPLKTKKKRNQPGKPDPDAEVVALSPRTLMATNRFICEICNKGFQRDQNLQLHRRGHNLPWKLRQKSSNEGTRKKVYVCPEPSCVHHHPSRALGDLTGIKKHFSRKHGEKKWKCDKCSKRYAVHSDWKAHVKVCGTREYTCDCGTLFSRKDTFITHRAFCDALAEESARLVTVSTAAAAAAPLFLLPSTSPWDSFPHSNPNQDYCNLESWQVGSSNTTPPVPHLSATALLQTASTMGLLSFSSALGCAGLGHSVPSMVASTVDAGEYLPLMHCASGDRCSTRDFLGVAAGGQPGEDELLLDLVTGAASYGPMGDPIIIRKQLAARGFPPVAWTWN